MADTEDQQTDEASDDFYTDAANYWSKVPATEDGMLGGFGFISKTDIGGSETFLSSIFKLKNPPGRKHALDCGSGIGRISKYLLTVHFDHVDLVEQNSEFLDIARTYLEDRGKKIGEVFAMGLQEFCPDARKYDIIWCQWVLGHLKDDDFVRFFNNCRTGLKENGMIVVKENTTSSNNVEVDTVDSSVTRPIDKLRQLFDQAGLISIKEQQQSKLPQGLYPVHMFALRPKGTVKNFQKCIRQ
ncbi:N-terminal Xaa-Pro-Lys N-methyltransferase 1-A [Athalia rosae]|uniref:N-terminal Xaa-Pro-Lys N-methyltransferase 1-A n=1 Tax=Athalia rosae TaxID=37344 RepID=UPI002034937E|nr:N-terminal Xaa-Pro-Lys N-methyltransferase 1-A [Athalia rosae]